VLGCLLCKRGATERLDLDAVTLLDRLPRRVRLGEEHTRVEREDARVGSRSKHHLEQHCLFLLEGARERDARMECLEGSADHFFGREGLGVSGRKWQWVGDSHVVSGGRQRAFGL
jgi:hypothetical protein